MHILPHAWKFLQEQGTKGGILAIIGAVVAGFILLNALPITEVKPGCTLSPLYRSACPTELLEGHLVADVIGICAGAFIGAWLSSVLFPKPES